MSNEELTARLAVIETLVGVLLNEVLSTKTDAEEVKRAIFENVRDNLAATDAPEEAREAARRTVNSILGVRIDRGA